MLDLLCLSFFTWSTVSGINISAFHIERAPKQDVTICVTNIITEIVKNNEYDLDVMLIDVENIVDISQLHGIKKTRYITRSMSWVQTKLSNRIYVTTNANFEEFKTTMKLNIDDIYFDPLANIINVIENFRNYEYDNMTRFLADNNIYNVTIITRGEDDVDYGIYSFHSPLQPCNQKERLVAVSNCSSYRGGSYIFPKIEALRGCSFQFMTYNIFPLINLDDRDEEGVYQKLIRYFETYAGIKIQLISFSKIDKLGRLVGNFTYIDILNKVAKNEAEGAVGGYFVSVEAIGKFSFGYPLTIDHSVVILPRSDLIDTWQALFKTNSGVVVLMFSIFIVFSISAYVLSLFPAHRVDLGRDILTMFGYFLNKAFVHKFKPGMPETILICSLLFSIFILPYTMQAYMTSIKTHPIRGYEAKEFEEVLPNHKLIITSEWDKKTIPKSIISCESQLDCLKMVRDCKDKSLYTLTTEALYQSYKWMLADEQCDLQLYRLKEPLGPLMRTMYFRRGSVLVQPFDKFMFRLMSSGIVERYYNEIMFRQLLKCKPQNILSDTVPLEMHDLKETFVLLVGGLFVSAVSFAYEVLTRRR